MRVERAGPPAHNTLRLAADLAPSRIKGIAGKSIYTHPPTVALILLALIAKAGFGRTSNCGLADFFLLGDATVGFRRARDQNL